VPRLPLIEDLTKEPVPPGSNILVEFDPASQWYNSSLTIAAGWIRSGGVASYNAQAQPPESARLQFKRLGLDAETLEKEEKLRILDWYTIQLGQKSKEKYANTSLKVADLSLLWSKEIIPSTGSPYPGAVYRRGADVLIIADDELVLLRFNDEKSFIHYWCTRVIPSAPARQSTQIAGAVKGVYSDYIYKSIEAAVDGIIDFKLEEEGKRTRDLMRIRSMRNVHFDREWHELKIGDNFEVTLEK
jgi:KaiC/GvpD/RAD55 family RecA-like ATPase